MLEERRSTILANVERYRHVVEELNVSSREEMRSIIEGTKFIRLDEEEIAGWEKFLCESEESARALAAQKEKIKELLQAQNGKSIAQRVLSEYQEKMENDHWNFKERESYILDVLCVLPDRIKEWKNVADAQKKLSENPAIQSLTATEIPKIDLFRNRVQFLNLPYPERRALVDQVQALLNVRKMGQEKQQKAIFEELDTWRKAGFMHPSKVHVWMLRIFDGKRSTAEVAAFMGNVVYPYMDRWVAARQEYDRLEEAMNATDTPRGFQRLTLDQFLLRSYKKKTSYLSLAWARMKDPDGSLEQNKELSALKLRTRHHIDTEDWEEAEKDLRTALTLAPNDAELRSMQLFITNHRPKNDAAEKKEQPDPHQILKDMRDIVTALPPEVQMLYQKALTRGPAVFGRLTQVMYNRVWLHDVAGWNPQIEEERIAYVRATKQQGKGILLDLNAGAGGMNSDDVLRQIQEHASENAGKSAPRLSSDEYWGYWTSVIPDISVDRQRSIVQRDHYRLKRGLRALHEADYVYTISDGLTRKDGRVAADKNEH